MEHRFTDTTIETLTGMNRVLLAKHRLRGNYNGKDLQSVLNFAARFGKLAVKTELLAHALARGRDITSVRDASKPEECHQFFEVGL